MGTARAFWEADVGAAGGGAPPFFSSAPFFTTASVCRSADYNPQRAAAPAAKTAPNEQARAATIAKSIPTASTGSKRAGRDDSKDEGKAIPYVLLWSVAEASTVIV